MSHYKDIRGDFESDFTDEQLEEIAAAIKEKARQYQLVYRGASPTHRDNVLQKNNNVKQAEPTKQRQKDIVEFKLYRCESCKVSCRDKVSLVRYNQTPRHLKKTIMGDDDYHCELINMMDTGKAEHLLFN